MQNHFFQLSISPSLGTVTAELVQPSAMNAMLVLSHGAGAGMNHSFLKQLSTELAAVGIGSIRYNFPYMEQGRKMPKAPSDDMKTIGVVLHAAHQQFPALPIFAGGKSYGGRMTSRYLAEEPLELVKGVIFYGFPLHPQGKPAVERAAHLKDVQQPMLFLQGTQDALADITLLEGVCASLPKATLRTYAGADHGFTKIPPKTLAADTRTWINALSV